MVVLMQRSRFRLVRWLIVLGFALTSYPPAAARQSGRVVDITAERFSFTPSEVRLKAGESIEVRLRSEDTDHGFRIIGTDIDVRIPKRGKGTVSAKFQPAREGRYTFECSHVCGAGHGFMRGTLVVSK
jgi:cytochrome c oxidase subunit 2